METITLAWTLPITDTLLLTETLPISDTWTVVALPGDELEYDVLLLSGNPTIAYTYDALFRLAEANYANGNYFHYSYDEVGNRTSETACVQCGSSPTETEFTYDDANRLHYVGTVEYDWDNNGNLTSDGVYTYTYNHANRLIAVDDDYSYAYNGLGDRVQTTVSGQGVTTYTLDLEAGLTQVLGDGTNTYLYGVGRLGQDDGGGMQYTLGDALGSVRQLVDEDSITLRRGYRPYGEGLDSAGSGETRYGFAGEWEDSYIGLVYLRARYYMPGVGRFMTRDTWGGNNQQPMSYNAWLYTYANPVTWTDPSGRCRPGDTRCINEAIKIIDEFKVTIELGSLASDVCWKGQMIRPDIPWETYYGLAVYWTTEELESVYKALRLTKDFLNKTNPPSYDTTVGNWKLTISRVVLTTSGSSYPTAVPGLQFIGGAHPKIEVAMSWAYKLNLDTGAGVIMHELFHVYDYSFWRFLFNPGFKSEQYNSSFAPPSGSLEKGDRCGTSNYACWNTLENFADNARVYALWYMWQNGPDSGDAWAVLNTVTEAGKVRDPETGEPLDDQKIIRDPREWNDDGARCKALDEIFGVTPPVCSDQ